MINGLDHIAVAVQDLDASIELWCSTFQVPLEHREIRQDQQVEVAVIRLGSLRLELVAPTSPDSKVAKFISERGEGLHHMALTAPSAQAELDRMHKSGVQLIDRNARKGAQGNNIGFIHPRALGGVLVE